MSSQTASILPPFSSPSLEGASQISPSESRSLRKISPAELQNIKSRGLTRFILIDIREEEDFLESKLKWQECLHVPPGEISLHRLHRRISLRLNESRSLDHLVLMDHNSQTIFENVYLQRLAQQLRYHSLLFLVGGFNAFVDAFPQEVLNTESLKEDISALTSELNRSFRVSPAPSICEAYSSPAFHSGAICLSRTEEDEEECQEDSLGSEASLSVFNAGMLEEPSKEELGNELRVIQSIKDRLKEEVRQKITDQMTK